CHLQDHHSFPTRRSSDLKLPYYPAAIGRFQTLLKDDPQFTGRDAVYFYLAESLIKIGRKPEALPYFERLVAEFEKSEYLEKARKDRKSTRLNSSHSQTSY